MHIKINFGECALSKIEVVKQSDYLAGYTNISKSLPHIEEALSILRESRLNWDFKLCPN